MRKILSAIAVGLAFAFFPALTSSAEDEISFAPAETTLQGRLLVDFVMLGSGKMLKGHILYLDEPISIHGNKDSEDKRNHRSVRNVDRILLEFTTNSVSDEFAGSVVFARGQLFNTPSDPHHTKVLMKAEEIFLLSQAEGGHPVGVVKSH